MYITFGDKKKELKKIKAISYKDYQEYGCPCCNNLNIPVKSHEFTVKENEASRIECQECGVDFIIQGAEVKESNIGFRNHRTEDFYVPTLEEHPNQEPAHTYVIPDKRPENGVGDFCNPRGFNGSEMACFVTSKEAGQRITKMINQIKNETPESNFTCYLDHREHEPFWIQAKINYSNDFKNRVLHSLIVNNDRTITEDMITKANEAEITFQSYWEYKAKHRYFSPADLELIRDLGDSGFSRKGITYYLQNEAGSQRNNRIDEFEMFATWSLVEKYMAKNNEEQAYKLLLHYYQMDKDPFNSLMTRENNGNGNNHISSLKGYFTEEIQKTLDLKDANYLHNGDVWRHQNSIKDKLITVLGEVKNSEYDELLDSIEQVIDRGDIETYINAVISKDSSKITDIREDMYIQLSLYGLYIQLSELREMYMNRSNHKKCLTAIKHVADQKNTQYFKTIDTSKYDNLYQIMRNYADTNYVTNRDLEENFEDIKVNVYVYQYR